MNKINKNNVLFEKTPTFPKPKKLPLKMKINSNFKTPQQTQQDIINNLNNKEIFKRNTELNDIARKNNINKDFHN